MSLTDSGNHPLALAAKETPSEGKTMNKKYEIDYYKVDGRPGGNQDWCKDFWMNLGGCAALAAGDMAICLSKNKGMESCCPLDPDHISRDDYNSYAMILKPYIRPRFNGVTRLSIFTYGFRRYLEDRGYEPEYALCPGGNSYEEAEEFVRDRIVNNLPIACLILSHKNPAMKDLNWHWFSLTGYEEKDGRFHVYYHTYGEKVLVDFRELWDTGSCIKGGMIALQDVKKI